MQHRKTLLAMTAVALLGTSAAAVADDHRRDGGRYSQRSDHDRRYDQRRGEYRREHRREHKREHRRDDRRKAHYRDYKRKHRKEHRRWRDHGFYGQRHRPRHYGYSPYYGKHRRGHRHDRYCDTRYHGRGYGSSVGIGLVFDGIAIEYRDYDW